jgi:two-component system sensor histidine kinase PilS (NtrC family)
LALVSGILVGAILVWSSAEPIQTLLATILFLAGLIVTAPSVWYTSLRAGQPGDKFVYLQVLFDVFLVTSVVHITGGGESPFAFVYILVISAGALLLPLPGGVLVGVLAAILFFADTVWLHADTLRLEVILQVALFSTVAVVTGWLGDRVRRAGLALGEVESALRLLQLGTGDILGNIATGVLTVDGAGRLVYLNPAGEAFLGLRFEQWQGVEVLEAVNDIAPGMATVLRSSMETSVPVARSKTLAERGGVEMVLGVSTTVLEREDGGTPSVTAIFQDITDQERLSALHRRNERLEAVAELSASLAHEIKNPLASIRSAVEQLSGNGLDGEDEQLLQRLVVTESDRLSRLLSDFIDFSALRMGSAREVDLSGLARDCITLVSRHPDVREGVRFQEVGMDREVRVPGDTDLLHRAVFNLVLNAAQFAGPAGIVRVEVQNREECAASVGNAVQDPVCLKVADSGPGVEPEEMPRIFDPFFTGRPGGSGLGLAVVHRAVEAHRGMVLVDKGRDGGAEFSIYLPGTRAAEREEAS